MSQVSYQADAFYYSKIRGCQEMTLSLPKKVHCKILIKRLIKVPNDVADGKMGLIKPLVNNFCTGMRFFRTHAFLYPWRILRASLILKALKTDERPHLLLGGSG